MFLEKVCRLSVRVEPDGNVLLLFVCLRGGEIEREANGDPLCYAVTLDRDDASLAAQVRRLTRWFADMAIRDIQAEMDAVHLATLPAQGTPAEPHQESRRAPRRRGRGRQAPPEEPPGTPS